MGGLGQTGHQHQAIAEESLTNVCWLMWRSTQCGWLEVLQADKSSLPSKPIYVGRLLVWFLYSNFKRITMLLRVVHRSSDLSSILRLAFDPQSGPWILRVVRRDRVDPANTEL